MGKNLLRAPLIKSAALLCVFSLIIYLTATSHEGSVWNSIGSIIYAVFKAAQLGVGLLLSLVLCLAVLIGIFLGCVAMVSSENASRMYGQLKGLIVEKFDFIQGFFKKEEGAELFSGMSVEEIRTTVGDEVAARMEPFLELRARIEKLEQDDRYDVLADRLHLQEVKVDVAEEGISAGADQYKLLQDQLNEIAQQLQALRSDSGASDLAESVATLESSRNELESLCASLEKGITAIREEMNTLQSRVEKVDADRPGETGPDDEHRLFSYITNRKEKEKVERLVLESLSNEMTNAQINEVLASKTGKATAKVISDHPSLTKDYIRSVRKKS